MRFTQYLLIGGGLASSQAAKMLAMKDPGSSVLMVCREPHLPYDRPPLSKEFLRGEKSPEEIIYDPASFFDEKNIDVRIGESVARLDADAKSATLAGGEAIRFEKALIATGGTPIRLAVPGGSLPGIHYLRSVEDAEAIRSQAVVGARAVVVGAGFIGMELAASLTTLGVKTTVIEALPHVWAKLLDRELAGFVSRYCEERGVSFFTGETVSAFFGESRVQTVATGSGREIECDFVCVGVGIRPETDLARTAGLEVDDGVVVNDRLQTSHPDIFAAGDAANFIDPIFGRRRRVEHWGHAEYSGQIAALNMTGQAQPYDLLSYGWSDVFDLHIEFAGDEAAHDRVVVRPGPETETFTVLYLARDVLTAYLAVNTDSREFPKLQKLIRRKTPLAGKDAELADPVFDLKTLLG
jgi:3-phenylpropionate/trans-cinnamate dioxygenase ferredoxin reductase subunit